MDADDLRELLLKPTLSVSEAGRVLGLGRNQAYAAVKRNEIPSIRFGGRIKIPTAHIREMLGINPRRPN